MERPHLVPRDRVRVEFRLPTPSQRRPIVARGNGTCRCLKLAPDSSSRATRNMRRPRKAQKFSVIQMNRFRLGQRHPVELRFVPRLASWNKADDPDQVRLRAYLD